MRCPFCKSFMAILELDNIELDNCFSCGGIWLDSGEIDVLLKDSSKKEEILQLLNKKAKLNEKKIRCPICKKKMNKANVLDQVIIDFCPNGHGYWFDGGELEKILSLADLGFDNEIVIYLKKIFRNKLKEEKE